MHMSGLKALRRCECDGRLNIVDIPGRPNCTRCADCGGWVALRINSMDELDALREVFRRDQSIDNDDT